MKVMMKGLVIYEKNYIVKYMSNNQNAISFESFLVIITGGHMSPFCIVEATWSLTYIFTQSCFPKLNIYKKFFKIKFFNCMLTVGNIWIFIFIFSFPYLWPINNGLPCWAYMFFGILFLFSKYLVSNQHYETIYFM